jgi:hypothetical protein
LSCWFNKAQEPLWWYLKVASVGFGSYSFNISQKARTFRENI